MQCVSASIPVAAVNVRGKPIVNSGSQIARFGIRCALMKPSFRPSFNVSSAARPTSLPVPDVVGTAITGATAAVIFGIPPRMAAYCSSDPECVAINAMPLARSIDEPPPTAMMPSQLPALKAFTATSSASSVGFDGVSLKMRSADQASPIAWAIRSIRPLATSPRSVTIIGRAMLSAASSLASSDVAPNPKWIVVR